MTVLWIGLRSAWTLVCLGIRFRLHARLVVAGVPLPVTDWVLRVMGTRWIPRLILALLVVQVVRDPRLLSHELQAFGWRDVLALGGAGAFRLFATATFWAKLRAVELNRIHRLDLRAALIWELAFWVLVSVIALPFLVRSQP